MIEINLHGLGFKCANGEIREWSEEKTAINSYSGATFNVSFPIGGVGFNIIKGVQTCVFSTPVRHDTTEPIELEVVDLGDGQYGFYGAPERCGKMNIYSMIVDTKANTYEYQFGDIDYSKVAKAKIVFNNPNYGL